MSKVSVVHFSRTPLAGAPYQLWQCLSKYSDKLDVRLINERDRYSDGRVFPKDLLFQGNTTAQTQLIKNADIIHIHNYLPLYLSQMIDKRRQKVIATFHSCPRLGNWQQLADYAHESYVIRQPMQMAEYDLPTLPNMFDIWKWMPNPDRDRIGICYAPTTQTTLDHPASKAYLQVTNALKSIKNRFTYIDIAIVERTPYLKNLEIKRNNSIMIDDVVAHHSTFHLTSLEGCAFGMATLNSLGNTDGFPFVRATHNDIVQVLTNLINNQSEMKERGLQARKWIEDSWNPLVLVSDYEKVYGV